MLFFINKFYFESSIYSILDSIRTPNKLFFYKLYVQIGGVRKNIYKLLLY